MHRRLMLVLLLVASMAPLHAQQEETTAPAEDKPYVLHVYQNLVQMVTLVATPDGKIVPPIPKSKFAISIDSGPKFLPTQMHMEGDDPVSLTILVDARGSQDDLLKNLPAALDSLSPEFLHAEDSISVYAFDCTFVRSALNLSATPGAASAAFSRALTAPTLHGAKQHRSCKKISLWDAALNTAEEVGSLPGWRVMLILSDGISKKGIYAPSQTTEFLQEKSIAVFGMRDLSEYTSQHIHQQSSNGSRFMVPVGDGSDEDLFDTLCQSNGGALQTVSTKSLPKTMRYFISVLRNRYILEFPRPDEDIPGRHIVEVTIPKTNLYIRPAGLTIPAATKRDPNTLAPTPSPATYGKRHPLDPTH
jgi:hypothetical protein